ncbi:aldo/keto reductase [Aureitalea marina]|uniref:Aldehyde oxidoreductase n=1 Tax=Aureitalea marina TaxID=930804 RepID=A0A2S7KNS6_9FLAO|nr:aldo/keto reductase [Aureitalea marina]PQB04284.1 aldehyde oxidoreductase [Aureitalea marina]
MKTIKFKNGDQAHAIGLGTWKATGETVKQAVKDAVNAGYRHIDTAAVYQNENEIGEALQEIFAEGNVKREDLFITSKLWNDAHASEDVLPALSESLDKLQLDYLDLYLIHWPVAFQKGIGFPSKPEDYRSLNEVPLITTWQEMEKAHAKGLTRHIGVSNFSQKKLEDLNSKAEIIPEVNQVELHPLLQQNALKEYCDKNGIILTAYSPLGSGDRPDAMKADNEPNLFDIPTIGQIAEKHGISPAQVLIGWHAARGSSAIPKSTNPVHMRSNLEAAEIALDKTDMADIAALDKHFRFIDGKFFEMPGSGYQNIYDE